MTVIYPENPNPQGSSRIKPSLADFLLARYAEQEAANPAVKWRVRWNGGVTSDYLSEAEARGAAAASARGGAELIGPVPRSKGRRARADLEAKRQIVDECVSRIESGDDGQGNLMTSGAHCGEFVLQQLAVPYADHPDYRPEWRP